MPAAYSRAICENLLGALWPARLAGRKSRGAMRLGAAAAAERRRDSRPVKFGGRAASNGAAFSTYCARRPRALDYFTPISGYFRGQLTQFRRGDLLPVLFRKFARELIVRDGVSGGEARGSSSAAS